MKKNHLIIALFILASSVTINCSKGKDEVKNCTDLISKVDEASTRYFANQTLANCQAFKTSLNNLLACSYLIEPERGQFKQIRDGLPC